MSQPKRWWIGLLPLGLIWLLANWMETPRVEQDILARANPAITAVTKDMTRRAVSVAGRDVTISGESLPGEAARHATDAAMQLQGPRLVNAAISTAAVQRPYTLAAERDGKTLSLTGFVPAADVKERLLAAARSAFGDAAVTDKIALAAGAPPQFEGTAVHGLQQLAKLAKGKFAMSDQTYSLEGAAVDSPAFASLAGLAGSLPSGFKPGTIAITAPPVNPFTFQAKHEGDTLVLTGFVPDLATREKLLAAARAANPGLKIDDKLAYASVAPQGFEAIAAHGLGLAGKLAAGNFSLSGATYNLTGAATDAPGYEAVLAALKALPGGASAGKIDVLPPEVKPFSWSVRRGDDGSIILDGVVPSAAVRDAILAQAAKLYPGVKIENRMQIARIAPEGFAAAALAALEQVGKLKGGAVRFADGAMSFSGEAADQSVADAIAKAFAGLGNLFKIASNGITIPAPKPVAPPPPPVPEVRVEVPPPPPLVLPAEAPKPVPPPAVVAVTPPVVAAKPSVSCERKGNAPLISGTVYFDEASYALAPEQEKVLNGLLETLKTCGDARVELIGHTNSHGSRARNIKLSSLRTFAASRFLQKNGVKQARIVTIGFGEDRPVLPDTTPEAAAKNRRVEINVR